MAMSTCYSKFLNKSLQKQHKSYPDVGLSIQKIYEAKYNHKDSLLVGTYIVFVVSN